MKKLVYTAALLLAATILATAQETSNEATFKRHRLSVSYAVPGFFELKGGSSEMDKNLNKYNKNKPVIIPGDYGYKIVGQNQASYSGLFSLSYGYKPLHNLEIGASVSFDQLSDQWTLYINPAGPETVTKKNYYVFFTPNITYMYISNKHIDLYSSVEGGLYYTWGNLDNLKEYIGDENRVGGAWQVWALGFRIKYQAVGIFADLGVGNMGLARFGLSLHF